MFIEVILILILLYCMFCLINYFFFYNKFEPFSTKNKTLNLNMNCSSGCSSDNNVITPYYGSWYGGNPYYPYYPYYYRRPYFW